MNLKKYFIYYTIVFTLTFLGIALCTFILDMFGITLPNSVAIPSIIIPAFLTSQKFVNDTKRIPNKSEKKSLVWGCLGIQLILPIPLLAVIGFGILIFENGLTETFDLIRQLPEMVSELSSSALLFGISIGLAFAVIMVLLTNTLSYGYLAKKHLKRLQK